MTGNRVEELEQTVAELEATVSGLTDELIETKERLRLIEDQFGPELDDLVEGTATRHGATPSTPDTEPDSADSGPADQEAVDEAVAESEVAPADGTKQEEGETEDDTAGTDDIIVA